MKTHCLQTNETQHYGKGKCLRSRGWSRERVALIKSLIMRDRKWRAWGAFAKLSWNCQLITERPRWERPQSYNYRKRHTKTNKEINKLKCRLQSYFQTDFEVLEIAFWFKNSKTNFFLSRLLKMSYNNLPWVLSLTFNFL